MTKKLFVFIIALAPLYIFAQPSLWSNDTTAKRIMQNDCEDRIFTKVENVASLNISVENFEDSLYSFLKSKKAVFNEDKIIFQFIVTTQSQILDIRKESGEIRKEKMAKEAILKYSSLWKPAQQNGRAVCSYVKLVLAMIQDKLHVVISQ